MTTPTRNSGMHTCSYFNSGTYSPSQLCRRHHARNRGFCRKTQPTTGQHATVTAQPRSTNGQLSPHQKIAKAFAPATIANLGPGFDWMGCAVEVCVKAQIGHMPFLPKMSVLWRCTVPIYSCNITKVCPTQLVQAISTCCRVREML